MKGVNNQEIKNRSTLADQKKFKKHYESRMKKVKHYIIHLGKIKRKVIDNQYLLYV